MSNTFKAGAAQVGITPKESQFLSGYPHVERYSTGVHDKLWSSALYLSDGKTDVLFVANDIIYVSKEVVSQARKRIEQATGVPAENIMITATHTHSGPNTVGYIGYGADSIVPEPDKKYLQFVEDGIVEAVANAVKNAEPARMGLAIADDMGIGTNRRDPNGASDHNVPVLMVKSLDDENIACMLVCSMHPTVMHEDSTLVSGDFPGLSRIYLQENVLGKNCVVLHHMGPSGDQSPRHVTKANTFEEAKRIGEVLGKAVEEVVPNVNYKTGLKIKAISKSISNLRKRQFPSVEDAQVRLDSAIEKLETLRQINAPSQETRTAECDWFGAEETLTLAKAVINGKLKKTYAQLLPVEIQIIKIGSWNFIGWQGEIFIEFGLKVKSRVKDAFVISCANGEMQGYIYYPRLSFPVFKWFEHGSFRPVAFSIPAHTSSASGKSFCTPA